MNCSIPKLNAWRRLGTPWRKPEIQIDNFRAQVEGATAAEQAHLLQYTEQVHTMVQYEEELAAARQAAAAATAEAAAAAAAQRAAAMATFRELFVPEGERMAGCEVRLLRRGWTLRTSAIR